MFAESPCGNEEQNVIHSNSVYPISILGKLSPSLNQVTTNIENSTRKRSNEGITLQDENTKSQKNPKLCVGWCDPEPLDGGVSAGSTNDHEFKHWVEVRTFTIHECYKIFFYTK